MSKIKNRNTEFSVTARDGDATGRFDAGLIPENSSRERTKTD